MKPQLLAYDGDLYLPDGEILIYVHPEGDCDCIPFPFTRDEQRQHLASVLYDCYETGDLDDSHGRIVLLPDGTEFNVDANLEGNDDHDA